LVVKTLAVVKQIDLSADQIMKAGLPRRFRAPWESGFFFADNLRMRLIGEFLKAGNEGCSRPFLSSDRDQTVGRPWRNLSWPPSHRLTTFRKKPG
jgi:hypothetical protein